MLKSTKNSLKLVKIDKKKSPNIQKGSKLLKIIQKCLKLLNTMKNTQNSLNCLKLLKTFKITQTNQKMLKITKSSSKMLESSNKR